MKGWHFLKEDRKLRWGTQEVVEVGKKITVDCKPVLCECGLHASAKPLDALRYAPGLIACHVEVGGEITNGNDKFAGTERTVLAMADATDLVLEFSRAAALSVVHLWEPEEIVMRYLLSGDRSIAAEAARAAWAAGTARAAWAAEAAGAAEAAEAAWAARAARAAWAAEVAGTAEAAWAAEQNEVLEDYLLELLYD